MLEKLTRETFAENLNTRFGVRVDEERAVEVELVEVTGGQQYEGTERFSVYFRGPSEHFLPQCTYRFEHERLGAFDLFIVPVKQDPKGFYYEAVFNRYTT